MNRFTRNLPRTVLVLGVVSLLTDLSSEMIYPLLPLFLTTVLGAGALAMGAIEGVSESTAALLKLASGIWADRLRRRKPLILAGYGLSSLVRPLIGLAAAWPAVLGLRFADRVGKGVRTSPRDALIADVTPSDERGAAYGFHRAMDHAGAVIGPLAAAVLLTAAGLTLRQVFLLAAVPAVVVILVIVLGIHETPQARLGGGRHFSLFENWNGLGRPFHRFVLAMAVFTLGNSSDAFLLLRLSQAGVAPTWVAILWAAHHLVKMAATWLGGRLSDRAGRRPLILSGWAVYAAVYLAFATVDSLPWLITVFMAYGIFFGLTEPAEKALVADLVPATLRGSAFGCYHGAVGLTALPASLLFGWVWEVWGHPAAFVMGAGLAALAAVLLLERRPEAEKEVI